MIWKRYIGLCVFQVLEEELIRKHMKTIVEVSISFHTIQGGQWLSGRVLDLRPRGNGFEPHGHHCVVSLSKTILA